MASLTRWTWVWVNSRSWWWTGRPGVLWFMGSQRVRQDWATDLIWSDLKQFRNIFLEHTELSIVSFSQCFKNVIPYITVYISWGICYILLLLLLLFSLYIMFLFSLLAFHLFSLFVYQHFVYYMSVTLKNVFVLLWFLWVSCNCILILEISWQFIHQIFVAPHSLFFYPDTQMIVYYLLSTTLGYSAFILFIVIFFCWLPWWLRL